MKQKEHRRTRKSSTWVPILAAAIVVLSARSSLADHYIVPSGSMLPTIEEGDRVLVDKLAFGLRIPFTEMILVEFDRPTPGEVVVLTSPETGVVLIKRVAAGPGDVVEVREGRLYLNGEVIPVRGDGDELVEELGTTAHPLRLIGGGGPDFGPFVVPSGQYLVLGDNRGNSHDGRLFGFVGRERVLGRAMAIFQRQGSWTYLRL